MRLSHVALAWLTALPSTAALTAAEWRSQSIYQVLTDRFSLTSGATNSACNAGNGVYCGGTWQGIIKNLDYIKNMGFTAIWISPVVENLAGNSADGEAYHGYWAQNIYEVNTNFGSAADLQALATALHNAGMYLMVDIVTNHMGYLGCGTCVQYNTFNPFNSQSYYHPFCLIDFNSSNMTQIQNCWEGDNTVSLPDLATENSNVLSMWQTWIKQLVANYTIDGLRMDSCFELDYGFFEPFQSSANVYIVGEVDNGDPAIVCPYQKNYGLNTLNYPAYYWITQAFQSTSGSISNLVNGLNTMKSECSDTTLLGSFMENHDNPRFPSLTSDISLAKNAIAFTMLADGIPIIYEGQEQHLNGGGVPNNREAIWLSGYSTSAVLYTHIKALNQIRSQAIKQNSAYVTTQAAVTYSDSSTIVTRKGSTGSQIVGVFSNKGANGNSYTLTLPSSDTSFTSNEQVVEVLSCTAYTTDSSGNLAVAMSGGLPRVFYSRSSLNGSGICPNLGSGGGTPTSTPPTSCTAIPVTFDEKVTTTFGQTIKIAGDISALGNWNTANAVTLSAANYTSSNPLWFVTLNLAPGQVVEYKYINVAQNGAVTWEADPNHTYTVPSACTAQPTVTNTWQG
ncbi:hypothetical protein TGAMA5MH_04519 [Trichoderma gamsii]|uniref:alpha-amylase n=1 Tax=Trichoderma gamsii TaxID=398673 RepID=A0A2K0TDG8_9HYPO|nr:hypothetical protein TGAMA5MH_04519 [Trichoderma gamsii]